jgi:hypothetical protein
MSTALTDDAPPAATASCSGVMETEFTSTSQSSSAELSRGTLPVDDDGDVDDSDDDVDDSKDEDVDDDDDASEDDDDDDDASDAPPPLG